MYAVQKKRLDIARKLLEIGADPNLVTHKKVTALGTAITSDHGGSSQYAIIEELVKSGADLNKKDNKGFGAIDYAEASGNGKCIELLKRHNEL